MSFYKNRNNTKNFYHSRKWKTEPTNKFVIKNATSQKQPAKQLGMTSAISLDGPRTEDLLKTNELNKTLASFNVDETQEELDQRLAVLARLSALVKQWIKAVAMAKNASEAAAAQLGGKICTFGSYRLGVHHKGADIDALCVAPHIIERADFFKSFFALLKQQTAVTECRAVEGAFVPVIKMKYYNIEIDLLFVSLSVKEIPDDFELCNDNLLKYLDPSSARSLNGCRVTDAILALVPNVETFRLALQAIKLWAKKRGIYSNSLGYFGGVTWAMLVARTCQLYPNATSSTLIHKFFLIFSRWKWPCPVLLKQPDNIDLGFPVWDPRSNASDRYHLMPIITPAYPQQNSTFNVSESTKKVLLNEFNRGMITTDEIMLGRATWDRLFEAPSFFFEYRHFVVLLVTSQTAEDQLQWCGLVESKIRLLVANLERDQHISLAHVNPKCFDYKKADKDTKTQSAIWEAPFCSMWFIGLEFKSVGESTVDLTKPIQHFTELLMRQAVNINMLKDGMEVYPRYVKRKSLSQYLDTDLLKSQRETKLKNQELANRKRSASEMSTTSESETEKEKNTEKKKRLSESERNV